MESKTATQTSTLSANLGQLPFFKNFDQDQIVTKVDTFRKGEKNLFWFLKLGVLAGIAYLTWVYVLPPVFQAIGQFMAVAATGVMIVAGIILAPVIVKGIRAFARFLHKSLIKYDPFAQLALERQKMLVNQSTFRIAKGKISQLKQDMEVQAKLSETEATQGQTDILKLQGKAEKIKLGMEEMVAKMGPAARSEDDYVNFAADFQKVVAKAQGMAHKLEQSKDFVQKYGTRAAIMKKMGQKLTMVETAMEIKLSDFDVTIEMLKKDYEFGQKSKEATNAAKSAMLFSKGWEFDYALEVVTSTIANDIAITAGNLRDIDSITSNFTMDSDELYTNLNLIADKIKVGSDVVPVAKSYSNPEFRPTSDDKLKSGGFQELFN